MPIIVVIAAIALLCFAILLVVRAIYKKKLNERLDEDKKTLERGGTPSGSGLHEKSELSVLAFALGLISCLISIVVLVTSLTTRIENQITTSGTNTNNSISRILTEIEQLKAEQKKARSILASVSVYQSEEDFWNEEAMTVRYHVVIVPKEISADTAVTFSVDGTIYETQKNGSEFSADVDRPLFCEKGDCASVGVSVSSGGVTKNEILTEDDTNTFPTLGNLLYTNSTIIFPCYTEKTWTPGHAYEPEIKKGSFEIDWWLDAKINAGVNDVAKCSVALYDGDLILLEQDLTDKMERESEKCYYIPEFKIEGKWKEIQSGCVDLVFSATDSKGYTVSEHERYYAEEEQYANRRYSTVVTAPDGSVLYQE